MRSPLPLRLIVPASLVLLVATLATLQYRWLGQVSEADRDRRQRSLSQRAAEFADDFDREVLRLYLGLQTSGSPVAPDGNESFAKGYDAWRESARFPEMLRAVYLVDGRTPASPKRYDADKRNFEPASWPASLAPAVDRVTAIASMHSPAVMPPPPPPAPTPGPPAGVTALGRSAATAASTLDQLRRLITERDPIVPSVPALVISLPVVMPASQESPVMAVRMGQAYLVAELDANAITNTVLPALAERYFPERDEDAYRFAVVDTSDHDRAVYSRGLGPGVTVDSAHADASVPLLSLRLDLAPQVNRLWVTQAARGTFTANVAPVHPDTGSRGVGGAASVSIFVESRGTTGDVIKFNQSISPAWQLRLQHTAGSLDAAVGAVRRRNLWLSFGILSVLAASVVLIVVSAQRWQRLAAQQMDFVAAVTHELRTPLTVIRSAAQNLSAGVVHEPQQARQYGDLIETEGRRLTDMVEQVLEYAGLSGNRPRPNARPVDIPVLVRDVVASTSAMPDAGDVEFAVDVPDDLPPVPGDEGALRRALHNLIGNALKHGGDGRWVGVSARRTLARGGDEVQLAVSDRGRGIDADDLAHIFDPFYRGRYAIERQIHGNGLGLSLVKRIAEAHGGRVTATSTPGGGTTFTITLPAPLRFERSKRAWVRADPADPIQPAAESGGTAH